MGSLEMLTSIDLRGNAVSRMAKYFERAVTRWAGVEKPFVVSAMHVRCDRSQAWSRRSVQRRKQSPQEYKFVVQYCLKGERKDGVPQQMKF